MLAQPLIGAAEVVKRRRVIGFSGQSLLKFRQRVFQFVAAGERNAQLIRAFRLELGNSDLDALSNKNLRRGPGDSEARTGDKRHFAVAPTYRLTLLSARLLLYGALILFFRPCFRKRPEPMAEIMAT
jgi:hypothetical protein